MAIEYTEYKTTGKRTERRNFNGQRFKYRFIYCHLFSYNFKDLFYFRLFLTFLYHFLSFFFFTCACLVNSFLIGCFILFSAFPLTVLSHLSYSSFELAAKINLQKIQTVQNEAFRSIVHSSWHCRNTITHNDLNIPPIRTTIKKSCY